MTTKDIETIKGTLSILIGQPLRKLDRSGGVIILNLGEFVEIDTIKIGSDGRPLRDENGRGIPVKELVGRYGIEVNCGMRLTCDDEILFTSGDISLPNSRIAIKPNFSFAEFATIWHIRGNNYFDEMVEKYHFEEPFNFIVKDIQVSKLGDLSLAFENGFAVNLFIDKSDDSLNWDFGEVNAYDSIILVTGSGPETELTGEERTVYE